MTDVIGWGDAEKVPRFRLGRVPRPIWALVAVLVAVVAAAQPVERHLGDRAAGWLARQWAVRLALTDARSTVALRLSQRAGVADGPQVLAGESALDRETADSLAALERRIARHRMWADDVRGAAGLARAAIRAEVRDLRAHRPSPGHPVYVGKQSTIELIARADRRIATLLEHRHQARARTVTRKLHAADSTLEHFSRPTDLPTGLRLVIDADEVSVIDLDTGHVMDRYEPLSEDPTDSAPAVVGSRLLVRERSGRSRLLGLGSQPSVALPRATYFTAGPNGLWQLSPGGRIRRLDGNGRPVGRPVSVPSGFDVQQSLSSPTYVLLSSTDVNATERELWWPATGARAPVPVWCSATGTERRVVAVPCTTADTVVIDLSTRHERTVDPPTAAHWDFTAPRVVSPDATAVAADMVDHAGRRGVAVTDISTGVVTRIPRSATLIPTSWSSDGRWLLLGRRSSDHALPPSVVDGDGLALWRRGGSRLMSVRLSPAPVTAASVALLQNGR